MKQRMLAIALSLLLGSAVQADDAKTKVRKLQLPETPYRYADVNLPAALQDPAEVRRLDNTPANNPITDAGAALGPRPLLRDPASPRTARSPVRHAITRNTPSPIRTASARGTRAKFTDRNAMPLVDVRYYPRGRFFWDERAPTLEDQVLMPIQNKVEMGQTPGGAHEMALRHP